MALRHYETVFILTPVLSDTQVKDAVEKFKKVLTDNNAELTNVEDWGLKKLAYPIDHKRTGFYTLIEFQANSEIVDTLETEYRRDEKLLRFLTTSLDKHAVIYNEKRRAGQFNKKPEVKEEAK